MTKEVKKAKDQGSYETLKALYFSGKVKPTLNKLVVEIEKDPSNIDLILLACECLLRGKDYEKLSAYADDCIKLDADNPKGYYFKGLSLHFLKGKEQDALKNFTLALSIEQENVLFLKAKADTHLALFKDYHLPISLAEKHGAKGEALLVQVIDIVEAKENPSYIEYLTIANVSIEINKNMDAKKYYLRAVNAFEKVEEADRDMNLYKELIKAQKACVKLIAKFTE